MTFPDPSRREEAAELREKATQLVTEVEHPKQLSNQEDKMAPYVFSFTKGLLHLDNGLLSDTDFALFRDGTESADPDVFRLVPLKTDGMVIKGQLLQEGQLGDWECPTAGLAYMLEGGLALSP